MKQKDLNNLGERYGNMLNKFKRDNNLKLVEEDDKNAFNSDVELVGDGPNDVDGYNEALDDEEDCCEDEETAEKSEDYFKESKKKSKLLVNSIMKKSKFDQLYSKVLQENFDQSDSFDSESDVDALGLDDATPDSDVDDFEDEGGDEVTVTLSKDLAQQLVDALQGVLGGEEDLDDFEGDDELDFGDDLDGDEDDGLDFEEDEEEGTSVAKDKKAAFMGKDNKVSGPPKPKSKKASGAVTDETGTKDGAPPIDKLQGKDNKVPSNLKKASDFFQ